MKQVDAKNLNIAYIGGGSRGWAWTLMTDLAKEKELAGTVKLYDIDVPAARRNEIIGNHLSSRKDVPGKWKYEVTERIEDALKDADFVIISILPKTFDEMEVDVHMPERLGVYQSVGDTAGPGGMMRALRTLPIFLGFANAIKENCPEAWVINYTNPMSLCVKALYTGFPEIKAFGCCHEVFGTQKVLAEIVMRTLGEKNVT
ncbi:MAG: alpha-glucosidase/alpha-galactosidase, partial [Lachnospiraceae bacterium]|nr:alpha-glucosidase/alpha-galactosidase [Lachnospiraceae bacterium]